MRLIEMHLLPLPFSQIKRGEKTVEVRLYDEKRRLIGIGDELVFRCGEERIAATAVALHQSRSFEELFAREELLRKAGFGFADAKEAAARMRGIYSEEEERRYGVLGIELLVRKEKEE